MNELLDIINEIVKWGLTSNIIIEDKEKDLEKNLVKLYAFSFDIKFEFDETEYADFNKSGINIRENVSKNFPDFGFYHTIGDCHKLLDKPEILTGDAIDDLTDIIFDLLEIKWRYENNSENDAWWYFELIFYSHTQQHLIDLLNFIKSKNG